MRQLQVPAISFMFRVDNSSATTSITPVVKHALFLRAQNAQHETNSAWTLDRLAKIKHAVMDVYGAHTYDHILLTGLACGVFHREFVVRNRVLLFHG